MATLFIREYTTMAKAFSDAMPIAAPQEPGTDQTAITLSGSSQQSAAFAALTRFIGLTADGVFSYKVGGDPTVTTSAFRVPAGAIIYVGVTPGHKVAVITNT